MVAIVPHAVIMAGRLSNATIIRGRGHEVRNRGHAFDLEAIAVSSGAECSSGSAASHAATEISPALVRGVVRVRLGWRIGQNAFSPLGEGTRRHYIEAISSPKWLPWRTFSKGRSNGSNSQRLS